MAGKLHELLAVEKDRKATALKIITETNNTFAKKQQLFSGHIRFFEPKTDDPQFQFEEAEESRLVTSVPEKLDYFEKHMVNLFDLLLQKETTNCEAKADIILNENDKAETIAENVPVTALVQLEGFLGSLRNKIYDTIPTLDPKRSWDKDDDRGEGYYRSSEKRVRRTKKDIEHAVVVPPTKEHPAVVKDHPKDVYVGDWVEKHFSGMLRPADKSVLLGRLSNIIDAIKKARARANDLEVKKVKIGNAIFKYIRKGL